MPLSFNSVEFLTLFKLLESGLTTDKDALEGIILVNYRQTSNQQDNPEQQEQAYLYKYSLKDHKFTSLTLLGIVKDSKY